MLEVKVTVMSKSIESMLRGAGIPVDLWPKVRKSTPETEMEVEQHLEAYTRIVNADRSRMLKEMENTGGREGWVYPYPEDHKIAEKMLEKLPTLHDAERFWQWRETCEKAQQACGLRDRSAVAVSYMLLSPTLQGRLNTSTPFQETWMILPRPIFFAWLREAIQAPDCLTYGKEALSRCRQMDGEELTRFAQRVITLMTRCNMATKGNKGATIPKLRNRQLFMEHLDRKSTRLNSSHSSVSRMPSSA